MSRLTMTISHYWDKIQGSLFPWLAEELDPLTEKQQQLVEILELVRVEEFLPVLTGCEGRPPKTRSRIEKQKTMSLEEMLKDLPKACNKGAKKDSKGNTMYWTGYKLL